MTDTRYRPRRAKRRIPAWPIYTAAALIAGFGCAVIANYTILPVELALGSLLLAFIAAFLVGLIPTMGLLWLAVWAVRRWSQ